MSTNLMFKVTGSYQYHVVTVEKRAILISVLISLVHLYLMLFTFQYIYSYLLSIIHLQYL